MLSTLTPEGVQTLKSNPQRIREVNKEIEQLGVSVTAQWAVLGQYDFVNIVEAPDEKTVRACRWSSARVAPRTTRPSSPSPSTTSSRRFDFRRQAGSRGGRRGPRARARAQPRPQPSEPGAVVCARKRRDRSRRRGVPGRRRHRGPRPRPSGGSRGGWARGPAGGRSGGRTWRVGTSRSSGPTPRGRAHRGARSASPSS